MVIRANKASIQCISSYPQYFSSILKYVCLSISLVLLLLFFNVRVQDENEDAKQNGDRDEDGQVKDAARNGAGDERSDAVFVFCIAWH